MGAENTKIPTDFYGPDVPALDVNAWAMAKELFAEYS